MSVVSVKRERKRQAEECGGNEGRRGGSNTCVQVPEGECETGGCWTGASTPILVYEGASHGVVGDWGASVSGVKPNGRVQCARTARKLRLVTAKNVTVRMSVCVP